MLAGAGFEPFASNAQLNITYGLKFAQEGDALTTMLRAMNLPNKADVGVAGMSRATYPIAKLYYTIGLAK